MASGTAVTDEVAPLSPSVRAVIEDPDRLAVLRALEAIDSPADPDFDRLTRLAAKLFQSEFALVTLLDAEHQQFKSCFGIDQLTGTPVDVSFCAHTLAAIDQDHLVILDTKTDPLFANNPYVVGPPHVRFYVGAPIVVHGQRLGTLCVLDPKPREGVDPESIAQLIDLAAVASTLFALKEEARVRARTAAALIREEWRHALTLEAGKVGSWVWDVATGDVACNDTFRRLHMLPERGSVLMTQVFDGLSADDRASMQAAFDSAFDEGADYEAEVRVQGNGRWVTMRGRVYQRDALGKPLVVMGVSLDMTEGKQVADQTRLLLRELNHRVKNTLAMIQSVARQTVRQNPDPQAFITAFTGRLRTISDAHVLLADRDWAGIHLHEVLASQLGQRFLTNPDRANISGDDLFLPSDHALGLGLVLHELTTNAKKFGAWSDDQGVVSIDWSLVDEPSRGVTLQWRETGGPSVVKPAEPGLGVKLIERSLAKVIDSSVKLEFLPEGVAARVWIPLPAETVH